MFLKKEVRGGGGGGGGAKIVHGGQLPPYFPHLRCHESILTQYHPFVAVLFTLFRLTKINLIMPCYHPALFTIKNIDKSFKKVQRPIDM